MLTLEEIKTKVQNNMSDYRYEHSLRVSDYAMKLAELNGYDVQKAQITGLVHDYAKEVSTEKFLDEIDRHQLDPELKKWSSAIWHGVVGAEIIREELEIVDDEILNAVRVHTTGAVDMTTLDKILFMADWLEPKREEEFNESDLDYKGIKTNTEKDLDYGVPVQLSFSIEHVASKKKAIYPTTLFAYNWWVGEIK
ncbi:MAG: bis(5'-nucleosyl)-tetraphosphatase (symmetrical) YqeK [Lactobacillaceae bacterium]|jgi:predicted HD superfamily hydrolase involved in NAD metabolism|nr:bis(5'-nucleosyl)-tetraphosphatase (symmetrical) YqeK [Lactobacillaceae bacterium]